MFFNWGFGEKRWAVALVTAAIVAGVTGSSAAKQPSREELEDRVRRLEQIIRDAGLDQPPAKRKKATTRTTTERESVTTTSEPSLDKEQVDAIVDEKLRKQKVLAGWKDGFFLESPNGDFKLKLRGYLQTDARVFPLEEGDTGTDSIFLRRVRPIFEGTVFKYFDFRIMPDFGGGSTVLQDGYARINYWSYAQLQAGKYKSPLSLERLQGGSELTFIERSIANNIAPNRDIGIALQGNFLDDKVYYQVGVFNGSIDGGLNDGDVTSDKDIQGRVFVEPFKGDGPAWIKGLGVGIGSTYGTAKNESYNNLNYRTTGRSTFFKFDTPTGTVVNFDGTRTRYAPSMYYYWGPFGFMGEYLSGDTDLQKVVTPRTGPNVKTDDTFHSDGWFAQVSYVVTGEDASYKQVVPINNFDPANGRFGAFELAFRASEVNVNQATFDRGLAVDSQATTNAMAYTGGLNWYFNRNFKVQFNYEHTDFDNEITYSGKGRGGEDVFLSRFQISY
jgi:phosphate-selective porin OprO and OprP